MKRFFLLSLLLLTVFSFAFVPSCREKSKVDDILKYQNGTPCYDIVFDTGTTEYRMKITLGKYDPESVFRDGSVIITDTTLEGVSFEMKSSRLTMTSFGNEYAIDEDTGSAMYPLFAAFCIDGATYADSDTDGSKFSKACFLGKYNFVITYGEGRMLPKDIEIDVGGQKYTVKFVN